MGKSKEKRRKSEGHSSADVRDAAVIEAKKAEETLNIKIQTIAEADDKAAPLIGYFPSCYDPLKYTNTESEPSVNIYKNASSRNPKKPRMQVVVEAPGTNVSFVGTNYSGEATAPQLCNYALGVLDKETGILKMVPIASNRIFRLDPKVAGSKEVPEKEPVDETKEEATEEEKNAQFNTTTLLYATKKSINRDKKRNTLRQIEGEPGTEKDMDLQLKQVVVNKEALEAVASVGDVRNVPPYDVDAVSPDMAYPLDKIILKGEWDYLTDIYDLVLSGSELDQSIYPSFVCRRAGKLETMEQDDSQKRRMAAILSFITHLIKYKDKHSMGGGSEAKRHKIPSILRLRFSQMFENGGSKKRLADEKLHLLISYVLVLTMFADDFKSDPSDIIKDLRMNVPTLRLHYKFLGCKFSKHEGSMVATLPIPLQFETLKRGKKRR